MSGHLEVIVGPMYAGKSEELIRRLRRSEIAKQTTVVFKPAIDDRYDESDIVSHNGLRAKAFPVQSSSSIIKIDEELGPFQVIAIDEVQFFDKNIFETIKELIYNDKRVITSGLDMDFRQEPFGLVPDLLAIAKEVLKLTAVCQKCGEDAMYTQRLLNGEPAPFDGETVIVGANEQYEARCGDCYERG